ncbi:MAG: FHA domain-containing protein [Cystobacterineae bacterium]|nr:FHA domain-containing protein [Cystobacterineae bacterium]
MGIILAILEGGDLGRQFVFERLPMLIGRTQACSAVLYHPSVSRKHCRFYAKNGQVFIEDLHSTNGTFVNGLPILLPAALYPGDVVAFGPIRLRFDTLPATLPRACLYTPSETLNPTPELTTLGRLPSPLAAPPHASCLQNLLRRLHRL